MVLKCVDLQYITLFDVWMTNKELDESISFIYFQRPMEKIPFMGEHVLGFFYSIFHFRIQEEEKMCSSFFILLIFFFF